jgi:hypothetical protein
MISPRGFNEGILTMILQRLSTVIAFSLFFFASITLASAEATDSTDSSPSAVSISNNSGGSIAVFALSAAEYRSSGTQVKFAGRCDSACTLFLGLPNTQTCISEGAVFRFHAPFGVSAPAQRAAQAYLMHKYPRWVRAWIGHNRGLTRQLITMNYAYASKFMRTCTSVTSR